MKNTNSSYIRLFPVVSLAFASNAIPAQEAAKDCVISGNASANQSQENMTDNAYLEFDLSAVSSC